MIQVFDPNSNKTGKAGIIYVKGKKVIFIYLNGKRIFPSSIIDNNDYNLELIGNHCSTCIDAKTTSIITFEGTTFAESESNVGTTRVMIPDGLVGENITIRALPFLGYKFKHWLNNLATDNLAISSNSTFTYKWSNYTTLTAVGEIDYDYCFIVFENLSIGDFDIINNNPMAGDRHLEISYTWDTYRGVDNDKKYLGKLMAKIPVKTPLYTDSSPNIPTENVTTNIIIRSYNVSIHDWEVTYQEAASSTINFLNPSIVEEEGYKHLHLDTLPGGTVYVVKALKEGSEDVEDTLITMYIDDNHSVYNTGTGTIQVWLDDEELSPVETITTYKLYRVQGRIGLIVRFKATPDDGSIFNGWDMGTQAYDMPAIQSSEHSITLKVSDNETSYHARFIKSSEEGGDDVSEYTIRFFDSDGTEYTSLKVTTSTETAIMPIPPSKINYTFVTWHYGSIDGTFTLNAGDTNTEVTRDEDWYAEWLLNSTTVEITEVTLNKTSTFLTIGDTDTLIATVVPSNATNTNVSWSSNAPSIATVTNGVITAVGAGSAIITCTSQADNTKTAICTVTVSNRSDNWVTSYSTATLGSEITSNRVTAAYTGGNASSTYNVTITLYQYNSNEVSEYSASDTVNCRTSNASDTITFSGSFSDTRLDSENTLNITTVYSNTTYNVASTNLTGVIHQNYGHTVTFNSNGGSTVESKTVAHGDTITTPTDPTKTNYAFSGWYSNSELTTKYTFGSIINFSITLYAKWTLTIIPVESVSLDKSTATIAIGKSTTLTATVSPSNATNNTITWSTSNSSVATVSNGTVTGKSSGTATITATSNNGKSASCSITVQAVGTNGWVGSGNAGAISMDDTNFTASGGYADVNNSTSAYASSLKYRVYNSDGITYTDYTPTISYSWLVTGNGLSVEQGNTANTLATYASRGATVGAARSGTIKRRATFTYGSYSTSLDSNAITVTLAANSSTKVIDNIEYGKPSTPSTNNSTKGVGAWTATYTSSVTNKLHWHYTYTSGYVGGAETPTNIVGTVSWSISWLECSGGNRFSISTSGVVSHSSMTTNAGIDQATVKATNAEDSSQSASASISTDTNVVTNSVKEEDISNNSGKGVTETEYKIDNISLSCTYSEITAAGGSQYPSTSYSYDFTTTSKTKYAIRYKYTYSTGSIGYSDWTTDGVNWLYDTPYKITLNLGGTILYSCSDSINTDPKFILESTSDGKVTAENLGTTSYPNGRSISISVELSINTGNATGSKIITTTASLHFNTSTPSSSSPSYTAKLLKSPSPYISNDVELTEKISADSTSIFFRLISSYSTYKLWTSGVCSDTNSVSEMVDLAGITPIIPGGKPNWISFPSESSTINKAIRISIDANTGGERTSRVYVNYNGRSYPDTEGISFTLEKYVAPLAPKFTINGVEYTASDFNPNYITHISNVYVFLVPVRISGDGNGNNVNNYCVVASGQPNKVLKIAGSFFITEPGKTTPTQVNITGNPVITRNLTSVGYADQTFSGYGVSVMEGGIAGTLNTAKSIGITEKL